jgi:alkylation response protein AidB-like acyl-CoA dehydrogenase
MLDYGIMFEHYSAAIGLSLIAHEATTSAAHADCNDEQRKRLLPDLIAGRKIGCTGSTEPDTGSDPRGIKTRLTRQGDSLLLNGRKMWITNVSVAT